MASAALALPALLLALAWLTLPASATSASLVGVNYGRLGDNLPPPEAVPRLVTSIGIGRVRIYDTDPAVLHAFANTGIELVVGFPDSYLPAMAADPDEALAWARANIQAYLPATKIAAVTVGNEVLTSSNDAGFALARCLVPAMEALHSALATLGLDRDVAVTTAHSLGVLAMPSYPPSTAVFRRELLPFICPLIAFHARTGTPFFANAYPYFAYESDPSGIALEYALLDPSAASITDPGSGLRYANLLHAQVDAVYHAIAAAGGDAGKRVEVWVSETGWPSAGDPDEIGATPENAGRYNSNLIRLVCEKKGTPLVPGRPSGRTSSLSSMRTRRRGGHRRGITGSSRPTAHPPTISTSRSRRRTTPPRAEAAKAAEAGRHRSQTTRPPRASSASPPQRNNGGRRLQWRQRRRRWWSQLLSCSCLLLVALTAETWKKATIVSISFGGTCNRFSLGQLASSSAVRCVGKLFDPTAATFPSFILLIDCSFCFLSFASSSTYFRLNNLF
ncbi:glycosyl hydrolases family 17 [Musa troglodytarum]|uniref:Glycosyl hydrolases family 17 n=1 Tax=Musa troglodytarum TaxID=320322 RepID=A0A9E7H3U5_9LILI|nr:glycosyl hydrolases family 17 [Musa troglodytarum]